MKVKPYKVYVGRSIVAVRTSDVIDPGVLLVGEANPRNPQARYVLWPFPGSAGERLRRHLSLDIARYGALWRANLCRQHWNGPEAAERAVELLGGTGDAAPWWLIVTLGRRVASAFGLRESGGLRVRQVGSWKFLELPHPSGRCRKWNDPTVSSTVIDILNSYAPQLYQRRR